MFNFKCSFVGFLVAIMILLLGCTDNGMSPIIEKSCTQPSVDTYVIETDGDFDLVYYNKPKFQGSWVDFIWDEDITWSCLPTRPLYIMKIDVEINFTIPEDVTLFLTLSNTWNWIGTDFPADTVTNLYRDANGGHGYVINKTVIKTYDINDYVERMDFWIQSNYNFHYTMNIKIYYTDELIEPPETKVPIDDPIKPLTH